MNSLATYKGYAAGTRQRMPSHSIQNRGNLSAVQRRDPSTLPCPDVSRVIGWTINIDGPWGSRYVERWKIGPHAHSEREVLRHSPAGPAYRCAPSRLGSRAEAEAPACEAP